MSSSPAARPEDSASEADGDVRWLSAAELEVWMSFAKLMTFLPAAMDAQLQRDADLTHFEYYVLAHLSEQPFRRSRMSDLAALTNGSASRLSHVVARLERRGYVARHPHPEDRRVVEACLLPDGFTKLVASAPGHVTCVRETVFDALTEQQQKQLLQISAAVLARLSCPRPEVAPGRDG